MSIHIKTGDAWHTCASVHVNVSGTWHTCKQVYIKTGDAWHPCILSSKTVSVDGPANNKASVTLSNVKNGSTVKYSGTILNPNGDPNGEGWGMGIDVKFTVTNASVSFFTASAASYQTQANFSGSFKANSTSIVITNTRSAGNNAGFKNFKIEYTQEYYP